MPRRWIELLSVASKAERRRAADELLAMTARDEAAVEALRAALGDPDARRRWGATFVLYRSGARDEHVFDCTLDALGDADGDVRWAAAGIAVSLARPDADRRRRIHAIAVDAGAPGRKMALYCLRDLGVNDETVFGQALRSVETGVRLAAAACLARVPALSRVGVDALLDALAHDTDPGVRRAAAVALGSGASCDAEVRPALQRICADATDPDLARAAERALAALAAAREAE